MITIETREQTIAYYEKYKNELTEKERQVFELRAGIDCEPKTLEEIAPIYGVTRERIRQIEKRVINKLKAKASV